MAAASNEGRGAIANAQRAEEFAQKKLAHLQDYIGEANDTTYS